MTTAGPANAGPAVADVLRHHTVPPAGFEPAHTAPEADALSPELRGLGTRGGYQRSTMPLKSEGSDVFARCAGADLPFSAGSSRVIMRPRDPLADSTRK